MGKEVKRVDLFSYNVTLYQYPSTLAISEWNYRWKQGILTTGRPGAFLVALKKFLTADHKARSSNMLIKIGCSGHQREGRYTHTSYNNW